MTNTPISDHHSLRTLAIGDIHGCANALRSLLQLIEQPFDSIVFLGDYIDRGPDSKMVIDLILDLKKKHNVITLLGNHEYMLLNYLAGHYKDFYLRYGGLQTLASYGISVDDHRPENFFPADHLAFYHNLLPYWEDSHAIYVHAGLLPGYQPNQQDLDSFLWIREKFIESNHDFGKPVIFGHTVFRQPFVDTYKIGIDTGAVYGGWLSGVILPELRFISVRGEREAPYKALS